ncbi:hypothetical protein PABG_06053 [Paracoccidioides brasiliensis Pb03]|uniref:Uncharacterized protein n=1 Tax=Paracoccidioides brasiliensis (strain Pb18) TaxID=502780 RepID=C1GHC2_PARBD|nr:uncharacterized protein PADG_06658 [Paracoccidioides brasiliensis Pb18]EEH15966.2 hypothetical protein PABG_06053 [Paracoccidioides brasiliensis Pb03]EEH50579.1 hypothetical protein PADG_06658 [Paracoccidioides brasiliensis Pb18]
MDPLSRNASSNTITTYLRLLRKSKTSLPYGQLICVSASPNISTMTALLRLVYAVGPFIAVLQVHADIIDDWSQKAARKLSFLARKYGFLIWEGGRVLNVSKRSGKHQSMTREQINRDVDLARKRYTKGVVSVAAWAGMVSSWVIGPEEQGKGGDRLVPTLRYAARETVAVLTKSVCTEISGGNEQRDMDDDGHSNSSTAGDDKDDEEINNGATLGDSLFFPAPRKGSVISLTQTITQHTEPSIPELSLTGENLYSDDEAYSDGDGIPTSPTTYPPPPLLTRGLVLCLPAVDDPAFSQEYRQYSVATAKAHSDFVVGFVSGESWIDVSQTGTIISPHTSSHDAGSDGEHETNGKSNEELAYVLFAPLESDHILFPGPDNMSPAPMDDIADSLAESVQVYLNVNDGSSSPRSSHLPLSPRQAATSAVQNQQIHTLHQLIARAISVRDAKARANHAQPDLQQESRENDFELLCIPVISMNA